MKKKLLAVSVALAALAATPAFAGGTHISVGLFSPAPVYAAPVYAAPVVYYPPTPVAYVEPVPRPWYPPRHAHRHHHPHDYQVGYGYGPRGPYYR